MKKRLKTADIDKLFNPALQPMWGKAWKLKNEEFIQ